MRLFSWLVFLPDPEPVISKCVPNQNQIKVYVPSNKFTNLQQYVHEYIVDESVQLVMIAFMVVVSFINPLIFFQSHNDAVLDERCSRRIGFSLSFDFSNVALKGKK